MIGRLDIIRMAHEAGFMAAGHPMNPWSAHTDQIEAFAALVAEEVRGQTIESEKAGWLYAIDKAIEGEREECAKIANAWQTDVLNPQYNCDCATAIRRRREK
jgi:hypothetical protein